MKSRFLTTLITILLGIALGPAAHAQLTNEWKDGTGKWEIGANWTLGVPLEDGEIIVGTLLGNGSAVITIDSANVLSNAINECLQVADLTVRGSGVSSRQLLVDTETRELR